MQIETFFWEKCLVIQPETTRDLRIKLSMKNFNCFFKKTKYLQPESMINEPKIIQSHQTEIPPMTKIRRRQKLCTKIEHQ